MGPPGSSASSGELRIKSTPFPFERVYGAWDGRTVTAGGKDAVERSAERYIRFLQRLPTD